MIKELGKQPWMMWFLDSVLLIKREPRLRETFKKVPPSRGAARENRASAEASDRWIGGLGMS